MVGDADLVLDDLEEELLDGLLLVLSDPDEELDLTLRVLLLFEEVDLEPDLEPEPDFLVLVEDLDLLTLGGEVS